MELATRARWCRHYAELNYLALRKIAKKRDRLLGGKIGEEFIQVLSTMDHQSSTITYQLVTSRCLLPVF